MLELSIFFLISYLIFCILCTIFYKRNWNKSLRIIIIIIIITAIIIIIIIIITAIIMIIIIIIIIIIIQNCVKIWLRDVFAERIPC